MQRITAQHVRDAAADPGAAILRMIEPGTDRLRVVVRRLEDDDVQRALRAGAATVLVGHEETACHVLAADGDHERAADTIGVRD